jgi:hypothetical protein
MNPLPFRPHHFLCTLSFQGKGYSPDFVQDYVALKERLEAPGGDEIPLIVTDEADLICQACPERVGTGCQSQNKIDRLDAAHLSMLGLKYGQVLTWGDAKRLLKEKIPPEKQPALCRGCEWLQLGICHQALKDLHGQG